MRGAAPVERVEAVMPEAAREGGIQPTSPVEHPAHARYHEHLLTLYRTQADQFGKTLVLLAGGALALSITFLEKLVGPRPVHKPLLIVGWIALVLSLGIELWVLLLSAKAVQSAADGYPWAEEQGEPGGTSTKLVKALNYIALVLVVIGIFLVALFAFFNMNGVTK